jgi:DivIVA domain-containing protein
MVMRGEDVRKVEFREKMRGYHPEDVDQLLERIADEVDAGRSPEGLLSDVSFREKMRGYHPSDVDNFLDRLRAEVATGVNGQVALEPEPDPSPVPGTEVFDFDTAQIEGGSSGGRLRSTTACPDPHASKGRWPLPAGP